MDLSALDWRSIAGVVLPYAPKIGTVLGTALGGPLGASIGGIAGTALATLFGTEATPEAVGKAIAEDPKAAEKISRLEAERGSEILSAAQVEIKRLEEQGLTTRHALTETHTTIRQEQGKVSWWHWRHQFGYLGLIYGYVGVIGIVKIMFYPSSGFTAADLSNLLNATSILTVSIFGAIGVVAIDTTNRVQTAMTGERGSGPVAALKAAVTGKGKT